MGLFNKKSPNLGTLLDTKAAALRERQASEAEAAKSFTIAASDAIRESQTAQKQATAVEDALVLLASAGVTA